MEKKKKSLEKKKTLKSAEGFCVRSPLFQYHKTQCNIVLKNISEKTAS